MYFLEVIGFITGIAGVWLAAKENLWNWPVGIINVIVYTFIFFQTKLYGDMALQLFYIVIGLYGWYSWLKRVEGPSAGQAGFELKISSCKKIKLFYVFLVSLPAFVVVVFLLKKTDTNVPYFDGLTTVLSLAATWMMARKYIEHWLVWIFVDFVYVGIYVYKLLYLTAVLYFIFTVLAVYGFFEWKKRMKLQTA